MEWKWERQLLSITSAKLIVQPNRWDIQAYFPGPDLRYSGEFWSLAADDVYDFADVLTQAWERLHELERVLPSDGNLSVDASMGVRIVARGWPGRGVTVHANHGLISTREHFVHVLRELSGLKEEATQVQRLLNGPQSPSDGVPRLPNSD